MKLIDQEPARVDDYLGRALGAALRLRSELERRGCTSLLELSGSKGYHLWVQLDQPVRARELRRWLIDVIQASSPLPEGIRVEEFPSRDTVKGDSVGPLIKLPLGVHSKTGRRCRLLDAKGEPLSDPIGALRTLPKLSREVIEGWSDQQRRARSAAVQPRELGAKALQLLERCHVLGALRKRAEEVFYLTHAERQILLCTLGHLGKEGAEAIHAIISHCHNYQAAVTDRQIGRMPASPISCPRIRERLPQITAAVGCSCVLDLGGSGYPTPLLHVRKASQISAFRERQAAQKGSGSPGSARAAETPDSPGETRADKALVMQRVHKIAELRKHLRGLERSIEREIQELARLFDEAGVEEMVLPVGTLRRTKRGDGEVGPGSQDVAQDVGPSSQASPQAWDFKIEV